MKKTILEFLYKKYNQFFYNKVLEDIPQNEINLEKLFNDNKHYFELLLVKDFVGQIPKEISEPTLKVFEDHGEMFEKWVLWQSYFVNCRSINDPKKIEFYHGMMVYLKVLQTMAKVHKKTRMAQTPQAPQTVEKSWVEKALDGLETFNDGIQSIKNPKIKERASEGNTTEEK